MKTHPTLRLARALVMALCLHLPAAGAIAMPPPLRFSPEFPVSPAMEQRVRFWIRVFTEVSHTEAVLHDRDEPRLVYDVVPAGGSGAAESLEATRASYDRLLTSIALGPAPAVLAAPPAPERAKVSTLFRAHGIPPQYRVRAIGNVRAQRGLREVFEDSLVRSQLYLPAIRKIFRDAKLPAELVYLPHVESSFNPNAVSKAGAAGLWQFTRDTAAPYLKNAAGADLRFDPTRSSAAAAQHLARAYGVLGSWPLTITAYNHGIAGMVRARNAVGSDSLDDIIRGYTGARFGFASQSFYAEVLAAAHVARNARYYFPNLKPEPLLQYVVRPGDSLWKIARKHQITVRELKVANGLQRAPLRQGQRIIIKRSSAA